MEKKGLFALLIVTALYFWFRTDSYVDDQTAIELKYHVELTTNASSGDTLPMIIALHGNGDTYDNFYKYTLKDLTVPARVVLIEAPGKYWPYELTQLNNYSAAIANFASKLQYDYPTKSKPTLLGFSGGAVVSYYSALMHCDTYSHVVPISGMLKPKMLPDDISMDNSCKVLAFHGKNDGVISFSSGKFAVDLLKEYSKKVKFVPYDGGHLGFARDFKLMILTKIGQNL